MPEEDNSLDASGGSKLYDATSSSLETTAPVVQAIPARRRPSLFKFNRLAFTVTGGTLAAIAIIVGLAFLFNQVQNSKASEIAGKKGSYDVSTISTNGIQQNESLKVGTADSLDVNGQLQVSNTVVLTPTEAPATPEAGQIYYDKVLNSLFYYNGSVFVPVANQNSVVSSLGGLTGAINPGAGLSAVGGSLQNTGVLSIQGQTGNVTFTAGGGVEISGTTISTVALPAGQLVLGTGASGFTTVAQASGAGQCLISTLGAPVFGSCTGSTQVTSLNGLINGLTLAEGTGIDITDNGSNIITIASTAAAAIASINGENGPTLTISNASVTAADTITINNALADGSTKGIAAFNATNFTSSTPGIIDTIQGISTSASPTFANLTSSGYLKGTALRNASDVVFTLPVTGSGSSRTLCYVDNSSNTNCPTGGDVTYGATHTSNKITALDGSGNLVDSELATLTGGLQYAGSGYLLDLVSGSTSTLTVDNSGAGVANLTVTGKITATQGLLQGTDTYTLASNGGNGGELCYVYLGISNCPTGGDVSYDTSGGQLHSAGTLAMFTASGVADSVLLQSGGNLSTTGSLTATGGIITNSITSNLAANSPTNDLVITSSNNNIQFSINGGARVFTFDTGGSTQYQTICTTGISCASGGGTAVLLGGSGAQNHVTSDPGIWLNTTVGTGALLRLQVSGSDRFVVNSQGEVNNLRLAGGGTPGTDYVSLSGGTQTGSATLTIPNLNGVNRDICLSSGNCIGSGVGVGGSGTTDTIAMFTASGTIGNSTLTQSGGNLTASGDVIVQGGSVTLGLASTQTGSLGFKHSGSAFTGTLIQDALSGDQTYTLPDESGEVCLTSGNCIGGSSGGAPSSAEYLTLSTHSGLTAERVLTAGTNIASFVDGGANGTLTVSVANNPTFSGLVTANGGLTIETGDTFTFNGDAFTDLTGTGLQITGGALQTTLGTSVDLASEVTGTLPVSNGGTGSTSFNTNGILYGNGAGAVLSTGLSANAILATDGSGVPDLVSTLPTAVQGNITSTGALTTGSIASGFGTISTGNNISTTANVQGANVNATTQIQLGGADINVAGTLTNVAYLNAGTNNFTGNASIQGALGLKLGGGLGGSAGQLGIYRTSGGYVTLKALDAAGSYDLSIPAITANDTVCLQTFNNCAGAGASAVGAIDGGTPNSDGATITSNTLYLQYATGLLPGLVSTGTQTLAGAKTLSGAAVFSAAGTGLTVNNNASVLGSGGLTVGVAGATQGKLVLATAGGGSITLQAASIASDYSISVPNSIAANDTFCLATLANCSGATLQQAYTSSVGTTTPEIKLDGTRGAIDIQDADSSIGASLLNIRASNGAGLGTVLASIGNTGNALFQASTNSANAFRVQNAGGTNMLAVDTNGGEVQSTRLAVSVGNATAALDVTQNSTGDIVRFNDGGTQVASIADGGAALFKNSVDSASAFRIQNTAGTTTLLNVDTTNLQTTHIGNTVLNGGVTVAGISAPGAPGVTNQGSAGSTTYRYAVTARTATGAETALSTVTTTTTGNATLNGSNFNRITWSVVAGAKDYRVYRTASYGTPSTTGLIQTTSALTYDDTGTAASGSLPTADASGNSSVAGTLAVTSAVTSGNALSVSASPVSAIANLITSNAFNVSRSTNSNAAAVVTLDTNASGGTSGATTNNWNHTVNNYSNRLLIVHIAAIQVPPSDPACSVTYAGNALTLAPGTNPVAVTNNAATASYRAYTYYLKNPTVGTYSVVVTCSSNTYTRQAWSDSWYNVDQTTPIVAGTPTTAAYAGPTSTTASISVTSTSSDAIVDTMAVTDNSPVTVSAGQTAFTTLTSRDGLYASWKPGSTGASTTMSYTGAGFATWAYNAYAIKAATTGSTLVTGAAAAISSNCSGAANCTDSSNLLNLNQQYASATGAVLQIQNSGVGAGLLVQNGSSTTALAADTVNGSVSVGTANANGVFSAGSSTYSTGTISQTTTTITGVGTTFTQNMSGGTIYYSDGTRSTVTYVSGTSLTSSVSKTVAVGSTYTIVYGGFSVAAGGSTRIQPTTNTTTAFQIQNAAGTSLVTADTTNTKLVLGGDLVANGVATSTTATTSGTGTNTTTLTFSGTTSFANGDVLYIDNVGQDYYTRIISGGTAASVTVSPAVTFETARTVTKFTVQSIGSPNDLTNNPANSARFFQGYFLGGVVTGAGSTTLSDGNLSSTTAMNFNSPSVTFKPTSDSTTAFQIQNNAGTNILAADSTNMRVAIGTRGTSTAQLFVSGYMPASALASVGGSNNTWGVAVQGRYAYIGTAATTNGFQVFDISNPASPLQFGSANATSSGKKRVKVQGKYAYVSSAGVSLTGTLEVFDISNPKVPVSVGTQTYTTTGSGNQPALYVQGRYAYVGDGSTRTLWVFDVSNPASIPAATQLTNVGGTGSGIADIYAQGRYVYLALSGAASTAQFQIIDMNNPTAPSIAGTVSNTYITGAVTSLAVQGRYAYVGATSGGAGYIYTVDISDPTQASPSVTSMNFGASSAASGLYAQGRTLYVADGTANVIRSADISTPSTPVGISGTSPTTGSAAAQALTGSGRYIYAVTGSSPTNTLQIFDMGGTYSQQIEAGGLETDTLSVRGNANLAGDASIQGSLNVSGQSLINGVLGITQYGANTGANAYAQGQLNVTRNYTATNAVTSISRDTTAGASCLSHNGQGNGNGSGPISCPITVPSASEVLIVTVTSLSNPPTPTYDGSPMTSITGGGGGQSYAYIYYVINPTVGAHTIATSNGGSYWHVNASLWRGVDISNGATSAFGTPPTPVYAPGNASGNTSITASTSYGQVVVDAVRMYYGGGSGVSGIPAGTGQTLVNGSQLGGIAPYTYQYGGQSSTVATGASTTMSWSASPFWSGGYYGAAAIQLKPASLTGTSYTGSLSSITSNCTLGTNGYCTDSSNVLSLNQQFASATGAVLKIQNSSTAPDIQLGNGLIRTTTDSTTAVRIQNAAGTATALNIDTTNNRVGIGTTSPTATLHIIGTAPPDQGGGAVGTNAADGLTVVAGTGGSNSNATFVGSGVAGNGGAINLTAGTGGAGTGYACGYGCYYIGVGGNGGSVNLTAGAAGTGVGGNGTAGNINLIGASGGSINIGASGVATTVQIGNTTGAVAQTINIGNNATASSTSTLVIGSTIGTSPVTLQSGTTGVKVKGANTTTAFQVQNASSSPIFNVDTTNGRVGIGNNAPSYQLDVTATSGDVASRVGTGTAGRSMFIQSVTGYGWITELANTGTGNCADGRLCWVYSGVGPKLSLDSSGNVRASGSITGSTTPDISETIPVTGDVEPADVVSADSGVAGHAKKTAIPYDPAVLGVISDGTSAFKINSHANDPEAADTGKYLVLAGRVPVKVTDEGGPIVPGDYLTSSSTPGYAMKATQSGPTIGKSLGFFSGTSGTVMIQTSLGYADPQPNMQGGNGNFTDLNVSGAATLGSLTVSGAANFQGNIIVGGHIITAGNTPDTEILGAAGSGASIAIDGNDTAGTITITTGGGATAGDLGKLIFSNAFGKAPKTILSAQDDASQDAKIFPAGKSASQFILRTSQVLPAGTYTFDYFIVQ